MGRYFRNSLRMMVFLVPGFPGDEADTTCLPPLQNYVRYFARMNPEITIAVIAFQYPFWEGSYRWHGVEIYAAGGCNRGGLRRLYTWLRVVLYFIRLTRRFRVTLIHSFWLGESAFLGQWLARWFRIRMMVSIMGQDARGSNRYAKRLRFHEMTLTCGSEFAASVFHKNTGKALPAIIPFGLDVSQMIVEPTEGFRPIDVLGVGSLIPVKNFELFVEVIEEVSRSFPALRAVIIGNGPQYEYLKRKIVEKRLQENLELPGELPREQVVECMCLSKILLHPAHFEGQGYVFLEALFCGLTVVSFDVGYRPTSEKVIICQHSRQMIETVKVLLRGKLDHHPQLPKTMEETVNAFRRLYGF